MAQGEIQCMSLDITNSGKVRSYSTVGTSFPLFPDTLSLDREAINRESEAPSLLPATTKWISPLRKWQIVQTCNFQMKTCLVQLGDSCYARHGVRI